MLLHINPTRQRGKRTGSLARASGWYMTFFAAGVILPDTDTRIGKDRTRPDLHERPVFIQYVTEPGDSFGQIKHLPEFAQAVRHGVPDLSNRGVNSQ